MSAYVAWLAGGAGAYDADMFQHTFDQLVETYIESEGGEGCTWEGTYEALCVCVQAVPSFGNLALLCALWRILATYETTHGVLSGDVASGALDSAWGCPDADLDAAWSEPAGF